MTETIEYNTVQLERLIEWTKNYARDTDETTRPYCSDLLNILVDLKDRYRYFINAAAARMLSNPTYSSYGNCAPKALWVPCFFRTAPDLFEGYQLLLPHGYAIYKPYGVLKKYEVSRYYSMLRLVDIYGNYFWPGKYVDGKCSDDDFLKSICFSILRALKVGTDREKYQITYITLYYDEGSSERKIKGECIDFNEPSTKDISLYGAGDPSFTPFHKVRRRWLPEGYGTPVLW